MILRKTRIASPSLGILLLVILTIFLMVQMMLYGKSSSSSSSSLTFCETTTTQVVSTVIGEVEEDSPSSSSSSSSAAATSLTSSLLPQQQQQQQQQQQMSSSLWRHNTYQNNDVNSTRSGYTIYEKDKPQYKWIGNTWIPPIGIKRYTSQDYYNFFSTQNVLFIGDSTMRRAYTTLYGILNTTNPDNISLEEIDSSRILDINKFNVEEVCTKRNFNTTGKGITARGKVWTNTSFLCRTIPAPTRTNHRPRSNVSHLDLSQEDQDEENDAIERRFDLGNAACYSTINEFCNYDMQYGQCTSSEYTIIVIGLGTWETSKGQTCSTSEHDGGPIQRLYDVLSWISTALPSSTTRIIWRTIGFHATGIGNKYNYLINNRTKQIMYQLNQKEIQRQQRKMKLQLPTTTNSKSNTTNTTKPKTMTEMTSTTNYNQFVGFNWSIVDWGREIESRSYGTSRIVGDIDAHYGLEGRLLFLQMLLHELLTN